MATKTKTSTTATPSYIDFEPYCEWNEEDGVETLVIHLPEFKKEQLRVQVNNLGVLKVSGERPTTADAKRSRFLKETKIPEGCDINEIRAKFSGSHLHITMPKKASSLTEKQQMKPETITTSDAPKSEITQKPKTEALDPNTEKLKAPSSDNGKSGASTSYYGQPKDDYKFRLGNSLGEMQVPKKKVMNVGLGIAIATMVAIGAYVAFKYGSSSSPPPNTED